MYILVQHLFYLKTTDCLQCLWPPLEYLFIGTENMYYYTNVKTEPAEKQQQMLFLI